MIDNLLEFLKSLTTAPKIAQPMVKSTHLS